MAKASAKTRLERHSALAATGSALPERVVPNSELAAKFATTDQWIREKIGIKTRRYAAPGQGVSDLAAEACRNALARAKLKPSDVDAIVLATSTSEYLAPGSGVLVQQKLGCKSIPAFDVRNTSPGFLFSLDLADGLIRSGRYDTVLVVGSEVHSTVLDFSDEGRMMSVIFGDGAGAFVLRSDTQPGGFVDFVLHSDGSHYDKLWYPGKRSLNEDGNPALPYLYPQMDGRFVFENAVKCMSEAAAELLKRNDLTLGDIDLFVSHQANLRIIDAIAEKLGVPKDKVPHNIEDVGNTNSASIPILMDQLNRAGKLGKGERILMFSFGSGFSWGAALLEM